MMLPGGSTQCRCVAREKQALRSNFVQRAGQQRTTHRIHLPCAMAVGVRRPGQGPNAHQLSHHSGRIRNAGGKWVDKEVVRDGIVSAAANHRHSGV